MIIKIKEAEIILTEEDKLVMKKSSQILKDIRDGMSNAKCERVICKNLEAGNMAFNRKEVQEMAWGLEYMSEAFSMDNNDGLGNTLC